MEESRPQLQEKSEQMTNYKFKINGKPYEVSVNGIADGTADVTVNGVNYSVEIENAPAAVTAPAPAPAASAAPAAPAAAAAPAGGKMVVSPLPGVVIDVCVKEGEAVKRGQKLAVLEAMKMENEILSESDGTVTKIFVKKGDSVLEGADIATIA